MKPLALAPGHRLHREVVVDLLWPEAEPQGAANNLHQILLYIRRMIGPTSIALGDDVVRLGPATGLSVDVDLFEHAAATARRGSDITALHHALQLQLQLWAGRLLPEDQYADWATEHRNRLTETHAAVATLLGWKLAEQGEPEAALALLEPLAATRPLDEDLHRALIDVLAGLGRRWEAVETSGYATPSTTPTPPNQNQKQNAGTSAGAGSATASRSTKIPGVMMTSGSRSSTRHDLRHLGCGWSPPYSRRRRHRSQPVESPLHT